MATRLVKRCACLLREAAHRAPAGPLAGRLSLARVAPKALTSSATSPSSRVLASLSQHLEKEQVTTPHPERQEVDELIEKAAGPEELLGLLAGGHRLQQNQAALAVIQLSRLLAEKPEDRAALVQDTRFQQLLQLINSQVGPRNPHRTPACPCCSCPWRFSVCPGDSPPSPGSGWWGRTLKA